jgi:hypothetical protein
VEKTVPLTGHCATRLPSSEVSFSKETTAIFLRITGSLAVSAAVRTGVLEAHPKNAMKAVQRMAMSAEEVLEKGFTVSPARSVSGW